MMSPTPHRDEPNLVRGVCVLGMLSQTFANALGPHAQHVYLQNARLDAVTAHAAGLVHQLCVGVTATQTQARNAATYASDSKDLPKAMCCYRAAIDLGTLTGEAVGHTECQATNGGFAKSRLKSHTSTSVSEGGLNFRAVVDSGSVPRVVLRGLVARLLSIGCLGKVAQGTIPLGVQHAVCEQLRVIERPLIASCQHDECGNRTLCAYAHALWQVEVHIASSSAECRAQEQRLWYCLEENATPLRKGHWRHTVAISAPTLSFNMATGVAAIETDATGIAPALEAARFIVVGLGLTVRAITVVNTGSFIKHGGSAHTLCRVGRVLDALHELDVPMVFSTDDNGFEVGSAVWSAADYRVARQHKGLQAVRYGARSEWARQARHRTLQFAAWLAHHPVRSASGCDRATLDLLPLCSAWCSVSDCDRLSCFESLSVGRRLV